jgi:hypothetical protein
MKKLFILNLLLLCTIATNAQMLKFGVKAGVNFADLEGASNTKMKTGFHAGGLVEIKLLENISVQPELLYSFQGADSDSDFFKDINYSYITVPVMAKFYLITDKLSLEAGPQFAFLINDNVDFEDPSTFDFAIDGGLGYNITSHIFVQGRYVIGLTDTTNDASITNRVIQLSAGFTF